MIYLSKSIHAALAMALVLGALATADTAFAGANENGQEKGPSVPKKAAVGARSDGPQIYQGFIAPWDNNPDIERQINLQRTQVVRFKQVDGENDSMTETERLRHRQIQLQYQVYDAFRDSTLGAKLNLTTQQLATLALYGEEWRKRVNDLSLEYRSDDPAAAERLDAMRKLSGERIYSLLTPDQRSVWTDAMGEPYAFSPTAYFHDQ